MNAVIYARYSSHNQREESIDGQIRECQEFALRNGITIVGEYIDRALTGKTDNRAAFQKMIRDSEKGHWEAVIMYTLDRLGRNRYDLAMYKAKLKKNGVRVFYAKQSIPDGPEGIVFESVLEGMAEYYSENLARNVQRGMRENALAGKTTGGKPPLGYRINKELHYEIEPVGAQIVREIFQMYADGVTAAGVVEHCIKNGYKTAIGRPFTRNSLSTIIRNEKYIGIYRCNDIEIPDAIPPIIDKALFEKVQGMIKHNYATRARGKAKMDYLLTTKVFCGHCGSPMLGESGTGRNGTIYHYYKCFHRKKGGNCDKKPENKDWLEDFVVRYTVEKVLTDENIDMIATKAMEIIEKESEDKSVLEGLKDSLKDTEKRLKNILDLMEQVQEQSQCPLTIYQAYAENDALSVIVQPDNDINDVAGFYGLLKSMLQQRNIPMGKLYIMDKPYCKTLFRSFTQFGRTTQTIKLPLIMQRKPFEELVKQIYDAS